MRDNSDINGRHSVGRKNKNKKIKRVCAEEEEKIISPKLYLLRRPFWQSFFRKTSGMLFKSIVQYNLLSGLRLPVVPDPVPDSQFLEFFPAESMACLGGRLFPHGSDSPCSL